MVKRIFNLLIYILLIYFIDSLTAAANAAPEDYHSLVVNSSFLIRIVILVPSPILLSQYIFPPKSSNILFTMERPRPFPKFLCDSSH